MRKLFNEVGKCPYCGSNNLDYGAMEPEDDMIYYPWTCNDCGKHGEEWYTMTFEGHNVENKDGDMVDVNDLSKEA